MDKVQEMKDQITNKFDKDSRSWHDYERAKKLIGDNFNYQEYKELIKFVTNHLGV